MTTVDFDGTSHELLAVYDDPDDQTVWQICTGERDVAADPSHVVVLRTIVWAEFTEVVMDVYAGDEMDGTRIRPNSNKASVPFRVVRRAVEIAGYQRRNPA